MSRAETEVASTKVDKDKGFFKTMFDGLKGRTLAANIAFQVFLGALLVFPLIIFWSVQYKHFKKDEDIFQITFGKDKKKKASKKSSGEKEEKTTAKTSEVDSNPSEKSDKESGKTKHSTKASDEDDDASSKVKSSHHTDPVSSLSASKKANRKPTELDYEIAAQINKAKDTAKVTFSYEPKFAKLGEIMKAVDAKLFNKLCIQRRDLLKDTIEKRYEKLDKKAIQSDDKKHKLRLNDFPAESVAFYKRIAAENNPNAFKNQDQLNDLLIQIAYKAKEDGVEDTLTIDLMPKELENNAYFWFLAQFINNAKQKVSAKLGGNDKGENNALKPLSDAFENVQSLVSTDVAIDENWVIRLNEEQTNELLKAKGLVTDKSFHSEVSSE